MKLIAVILIVFGVISLYVNHTFSEKEKQLESVASIFNQACQTNEGCDINPEGWSKEDGYYYKSMMEYWATKDEFKIHYHIATDTWLLATGGKNKKVVIKNIGERN